MNGPTAELAKEKEAIHYFDILDFGYYFECCPDCCTDYFFNEIHLFLTERQEYFVEQNEIGSIACQTLPEWL